MKSLVCILSFFASIAIYSQEQKNYIPQISISGEGKIKTTPDQVEVTVGFFNSGKDAKEVKNINDDVVNKVIKFLKQSGIPSTDFKTTNVSLYKNYDYKSKIYNFQASQSLMLTLNDLSQYDVIMNGLNEAGVNSISGIEFKSSKLKEIEREARKIAIKDAKEKAEDYASVLGQKVGKALTITDNSQPNFVQPYYRDMVMAVALKEESQPRETLAVGELEIKANVSVIFVLE